MLWKIRKNGGVVKSSIEWIYAHCVEHSFFKDEIYSSIVMQLRDEKHPLPPFEIDSNFREAFANLMDEKADTFPLKNQDVEAWNVDSSVYDASHQFLTELLERQSNA